MRLFLSTFVLCAAFASQAQAEKYSCGFDNRNAKYELIVTTKGEAEYVAEIQVIERKTQQEVAFYRAHYAPTRSSYVFGPSREYSLIIDGFDSVGVDDSGPFDFEVIFGYAKLPEVSESFHCYRLRD